MNVVVFGGSGLVGRRLVAILVEQGHHVIVPVRDRERAKHSLIVLPNTDVVGCDPLAARSIDVLTSRSEIVINLIGILHEQGHKTFELVHNEFPRMLCEAVERKGLVRQLIHVSALNAAPGAPSKYLRSKGKAEALVSKLGKVKTTIVRPSVLFGCGDRFLNLYARLARYTPVLAVPCPQAKFQPLWADDLASMLAACIGNPSCYHKILFAGGPEILSLRTIVNKLLAARDWHRLVLPLSRLPAEILAGTLGLIPFLPPLLTHDNLASMSVPCTCEHNNDAPRLVNELTALDTYLATGTSNVRSEAFNRMRLNARRD